MGCGFGFWRVMCARALGAGLLCLLLGGCADIRFERSPYAIRAIDMVYSEQEDLTFLVWRLRDSADPDLVRFELYQDGRYRELELERAPFSAAPYACDKYYLCFQYQLKGRYSFPDEVLPLRSIHESEGLYAGTAPRRQEIKRSFGVEPIGVDNNYSISPNRYDWFALNNVPLKRRYQWQLVGSSADYGRGDESVCSPPQVAAWAALNDPQPVDYAWVEAAKCFVMRPIREDQDSVHVSVPFFPAAELFHEQQDYLPQEERPALLYLYLLDLLIRSPTRCLEAKRGVIGELDRRISQRQAQGGDLQRLGSFTPIDTQTGIPTDGCQQGADQDYPVQQIVETIKQVAAQYEPTTVRVVIFYMNNVELPPSERVLTQLGLLGQELLFISNVEPYSVAISSNVVTGLFEWNAGIPWRPINDETFFGDLKGWAERSVPFRTMLHDFDTEVIIRQPVESKRRPQRFKICTMTPSALLGVGSEPGLTQWGPEQDYYDWPPSGQPHYLVGLAPQLVVPFEEYQRFMVSTVVEVCERFCDFPFRTRSGVVPGAWSQTRLCQWVD